jgi:transcriptional regulator with XRE-family HTH domain
MAAKRLNTVELPAKKRGPRTPRWAREGERLAKILADRGIGQTQFGERIGRKFHTVHRWCKGFEFGPDNQTVAAQALDLPPDAFATPNATKRREREARAVFERFLNEKPIAETLTTEELQILSSIRFLGPGIRPTVAFFESVSYALKGAIRVDEIMSVAEENAALDESIAHKPPLRRK